MIWPEPPRLFEFGQKGEGAGGEGPTFGTIIRLSGRLVAPHNLVIDVPPTRGRGACPRAKRRMPVCPGRS